MPENEPITHLNTESESSSSSNSIPSSPQPSTSRVHTRKNPKGPLLGPLPDPTRSRKQLPIMTTQTLAKPSFQRFAGAKTKIKITSWLSLLEVLTVGQEITDDKKKICFLMQYLEDEALQFFADDIAPQMATITWDEVTNLLTTRFGERTIDPVLAASRRHWNRGNESVQEYYEDKMYLLRRTGLSEASMAEVLTDGMPFQFRNNLISATIPTTSDWLNKAVRLEASFNTKSKVDHPRAIAAMVQGSQKPKSRSKRPPPGPCKFCKALNKTDEQANHWQSDCQNKPSGSKNQKNYYAENLSSEQEANSTDHLNY